MIELVRALAPDPAALVVGVAIDLLLGDPVYPAHPVRLIGRTPAVVRKPAARRWPRWLWWRNPAVRSARRPSGSALSPGSSRSRWRSRRLRLGWSTSCWLYSLLALGDLLHHVWRIESAVRDNDIDRARQLGQRVGRARYRSDGRPGVPAGRSREPQREPDGRLRHPHFLVRVRRCARTLLFKIVSTMDSMVGYKTPQYLQFGWCGARLDDVMNYLPARLTWFVIACVALVSPGLSGPKAWRIGFEQHAVLLGPNSGWSEAATAGALERRIVGPIWLKGDLVTDQWVGDPGDPPLSTGDDVRRAIVLAWYSSGWLPSRPVRSYRQWRDCELLRSDPAISDLMAVASPVSDRLALECEGLRAFAADEFVMRLDLTRGFPKARIATAAARRTFTIGCEGLPPSGAGSDARGKFPRPKADFRRAHRR